MDKEATAERYNDRELKVSPEKRKRTAEQSDPHTSRRPVKLGDCWDLISFDGGSQGSLQQSLLLPGLEFASTVDWSTLDHNTVPNSHPSPSHSLIESSKCTVRDLRALPLTSLTAGQQGCFLQAVHVLRKAFPYHRELDRIGRESISWFEGFESCCKCIVQLRDKLLPFYQVANDIKANLLESKVVLPEADRIYFEWEEKRNRQNEMETAIINLRSQIKALQSKQMAEGAQETEEAEDCLSIGSQIEQLQDKLKDKEAEFVVVRKEVDDLLFKCNESMHQCKVLFSERSRLLQCIGSLDQNVIIWSRDFMYAYKKYAFLTEKWISLSQLDLDSLAESSSKESVAKGELSDCSQTLRMMH